MNTHPNNTPPTSVQPPQQDGFSIFGLHISSLRYQQFCDLLVANKLPSPVCLTCNLVPIVSNYINRPDMLAFFNRSCINVVDGLNLRLLCILKTHRKPDVFSGSDMMFHLSELASRNNLKLFIYGGSPQSNQLAVANLRTKYSYQQIHGDPGLFSSDAAAIADDLAEHLHELKPHVVFLCIGVPKQELVIRKIHDSLKPLGVRCIINAGAAADHASGLVKRASPLLVRLQLEWAYRVVLHPRRYLIRYAASFLKILYYSIKLKISPPSREQSALQSDEHRPRT